NSTYTLPSVQVSDQGTYRCAITSPLGSVTSSAASLSIVPIPTNGYAGVVLADNPIAYWPLNETSGTVAYDAWGSHDGQYTNVTLGLPGFNPSAPDTAIQVGPGTNSFVANVQGIDFATTGSNAAFAVECWVNAAPNPFNRSGAGIIT